jgi:hypothetical protein
MANTGYISSSGIDQRFTTGPYSGSIVTSSYSSGSTLLGPIITFYQSFISGTVDDIAVCDDVFERYYYDPINCPLGNCLPPIALIASVDNCNVTNYNYNFTFNSGSISADYSTIEYSTIPDFSFNTGSLIVTNSIGHTNPINISSLELLPLNTTPVYFRVFNSCSISGTSSYSNIITASCLTPPPPSTSPFIVNLKNTIGSTLFYIYNGIEYSLFNNNNTNLTITDLNPISFTFRTLKPDNEVYTIVVSGSSPDFNGSVSTALTDETLTPSGFPSYQFINDYQANLYYNTEGTPDASIEVDRSLWNGDGVLELNFSSFVPFGEANPWYSEELGGGGFGP